MRNPTCYNFPWIFCQGCETSDKRFNKDGKCFVASPWIFQAGVTETTIIRVEIPCPNLDFLNEIFRSLTEA